MRLEEVSTERYDPADWTHQLEWDVLTSSRECMIEHDVVEHILFGSILFLANSAEMDRSIIIFQSRVKRMEMSLDRSL